MTLSLSCCWVQVMRIVHSSAPIPVEVRSGEPLEVNVLFTSSTGAIAAIRAASRLADKLAARIRVIVPQLVPFPLPLTEPPIRREFTARRIEAILALEAIEADVQVCLCREKPDAPLSVLKPHSLIVIGASRRHWRTEEDSMALILRRQGHEVMVVRSRK
jgi:hypothetical protein